MNLSILLVSMLAYSGADAIFAQDSSSARIIVQDSTKGTDGSDLYEVLDSQPQEDQGFLYKSVGVPGSFLISCRKDLSTEMVSCTLSFWKGETYIDRKHRLIVYYVSDERVEELRKLFWFEGQGRFFQSNDERLVFSSADQGHSELIHFKINYSE